jgi:UDP-glucose 4-epimerase
VARSLVTGADGFIGSHLAERLRRDGHDVTAFCQYNSKGSAGWLDGLDFDVVLGDIRDARLVEEVCQSIEVVYHLAALIDVPYSYLAAASYVDTNVKGTLNVLEAARAHGCRVVHTSSSEVYGTPETVPIRESHPVHAQSPYAATKIAGDQLALAYSALGVNVVVLRPFNTYGPRQSTRAILPTILTQLLKGKQEITLGRTDTKRDLTYVSDTVEGFVRATQAKSGTVVHLGTGLSVTVMELVGMCCRILGVRAEIVTDQSKVRPEASEVQRLESDPGLAKRLLGWEPKVSLEEGIRMTAEWLRENPTV